MLRAIVFAAMINIVIACAATDPEASPPETVDHTTLESQPDSEKPSETGKTDEAVEYTPIRFDLPTRDAEPTDAERNRCTEAGGSVQRAGLAGAYHCVQTYPDAGKVCRDSKDCIGNCRAVNSVKIGKPGTGTCQTVDIPFGCYALVRNGVVDGGMLCVD